MNSMRGTMADCCNQNEIACSAPPFFFSHAFASSVRGHSSPHNFQKFGPFMVVRQLVAVIPDAFAKPAEIIKRQYAFDGVAQEGKGISPLHQWACECVAEMARDEPEFHQPPYIAPMDCYV